MFVMASFTSAVSSGLDKSTNIRSCVVVCPNNLELFLTDYLRAEFVYRLAVARKSKSNFQW